jgi:hypothetical protein
MKTKHFAMEIEHPQLEMKHLQAAKKHFQVVTEHSEHCEASRPEIHQRSTVIRSGILS